MYALLLRFMPTRLLKSASSYGGWPLKLFDCSERDEGGGGGVG